MSLPKLISRRVLNILVTPKVLAKVPFALRMFLHEKGISIEFNCSEKSTNDGTFAIYTITHRGVFVELICGLRAAPYTESEICACVESKVSDLTGKQLFDILAREEQQWAHRQNAEIAAVFMAIRNNEASTSDNIDAARAKLSAGKTDIAEQVRAFITEISILRSSLASM